MEKGKVAGNSPKIVELIKGTRYKWCTCGLSKNQPWCDNEHREKTLLRSLKFVPKEDKNAAMCMCKQTKTPPFCDGSHKNL